MMKTIWLGRTSLEWLYCLLCFIFVGYFVILQFEAYISNKDSSSVAYKNIRNDNDEFHPTFSICLFGRGGKIFKPDCGDIMSCYTNYYETLSGQVEDRMNYSTFDFDNQVRGISNMILDYHIVTKRGDIIQKKSRLNDKSKSIFHKAYQDSEQVCFTKEEPKERGIPLKRDSLEALLIMKMDLRTK